MVREKNPFADERFLRATKAQHLLRASPCLTSLDVSRYGVRAEFLVGHYIIVSSPFGDTGGRVSEA